MGTNKSHGAANTLVHALHMLGLFSGVGLPDTFPSAGYPLETMEVGKVLGQNHRKTQSLLARTSQSRGTELSWQMLFDFVEVMGRHLALDWGWGGA